MRNITLVALSPPSLSSLLQTSFRPIFASPVIFTATVIVRACKRDRPMRNGLDSLGGGLGTRWKNNKPRDTRHTRRRGRRLRTTTYMDGWVYITSIGLRSHACRRSLAPYTPQTHTTTLHEPLRAVIIEYQTIIFKRVFTPILLNECDKNNYTFLFGRGGDLALRILFYAPPPQIFNILFDFSVKQPQ